MRGHDRNLLDATLRRAVDALPTPGETFAGMLLWGVAMGATGYAAVWQMMWATSAKKAEVALLFAVGGALAFPFAAFAARFLSRGRQAEARYAAALLCLAVATVAGTAFVYALHYRYYYAQWHAPTFSITWTFQLVFTTAAAVYQFLVMGLRLYFPFGFALLLAASLWLAARAR